MTMLNVMPNFHFQGQCRDAIALYEKAFGAVITELLQYVEADPADWIEPLTAEQQKYIYHAELSIGNQRVFLSDTIQDGNRQCSSLSLVVTFDHADDVMKAYDVLKEGCTLVHPMKQTTYSTCFVSLIDRFGFRWELMTE